MFMYNAFLIVSQNQNMANGCTRRDGWSRPLPCGAPRPMSFLWCSGHVLLCGFRVCSRVWDRFYLSPSPLLISRWGGCSIEQQEETGQALFFPLALRGFQL